MSEPAKASGLPLEREPATRAAAESVSLEDIRQLYNENLSQILAFLYSYVKNEADAEDLLQEVFCQIYEKAQRGLLEKDNLKAYLFKSARNQALNLLNRKKNLQSKVDNWVEEPRENLEETMINEILLESLYDYIEDQFSEQEKSIFKLRFYHNMKLTEIANVTDLSVATVSRVVNSLIDKLKVLSQ